MTTKHSNNNIWSAFPLVYGVAFLFAITKAVFAFWADDLPSHFITSFPNHADQIYAKWSLNIFTTAVGFFVLILYFRLELFEHNNEIPDLERKGKAWRLFEYFSRVVIVTIITLKIIQWSDYKSLFTFYFLLTSAFAIWIIVLNSAALPFTAQQKYTYLLLPFLSFALLLLEPISAAFAVTALILIAALTALGAVIEFLYIIKPYIRQPEY